MQNKKFLQNKKWVLFSSLFDDGSNFGINITHQNSASEYIVSCKESFVQRLNRWAAAFQEKKN